MRRKREHERCEVGKHGVKLDSEIARCRRERLDSIYLAKLCKPLCGISTAWFLTAAVTIGDASRW